MPAERTPDQRALAARIAAHHKWATTDPVEGTAAARLAFDARFYADIPTDLPPAERDRRAEHKRKAYFLTLALKSAQARRKPAVA